MSKTLLDKIWEAHVISGEEGQSQLLYVDIHFLHEVTSPQAFLGLRENNRKVRRPERTFATMDHNVPTLDPETITDETAKIQIESLQKNCDDFHIDLANISDERQGIIHVIGPELGFTQPGRTIVCGDSHTATHGAFGALAFGIGTSEVEHVLATQTLWQKKPKSMGVEIKGRLPKGVYAKDVILKLLADYGVTMGTGTIIEFYGDWISSLSMEERMTICNMAIEGGAKGGLIAPDEITFKYLRGKANAPINMEAAIKEWKNFYTDSDGVYDRRISLDVSDMAPMITWGTNPGMGVAIHEPFPEIKDENDKRAYDYMGLKPGQFASEIPITQVFIGSCTNSRLSDLIEASKYIKGKKVKEGVRALVVPGSKEVKKMAEGLGLNQIFEEAGFLWREPGCSMCLAMNPDQVPPTEHCASTSNRNFEGRQGKGARTHLVSPVMAAVAAIHGHFVDVREENYNGALS